MTFARPVGRVEGSVRPTHNRGIAGSDLRRAGRAERVAGLLHSGRDPRDPGWRPVPADLEAPRLTVNPLAAITATGTSVATAGAFPRTTAYHLDGRHARTDLTRVNRRRVADSGDRRRQDLWLVAERGDPEVDNCRRCE